MNDCDVMFLAKDATAQIMSVAISIDDVSSDIRAEQRIEEIVESAITRAIENERRVRDAMRERIAIEIAQSVTRGFENETYWRANVRDHALEVLSRKRD